MFNKERFVQDCRDAVTEGQGAIRELVARAVSDPASVMAGLGEPEHAAIPPLYRSHDLTIINFVWAPRMTLMPHKHQMFSIVGIYSGREDNVFWRRAEASIEAASALARSRRRCGPGSRHDPLRAQSDRQDDLLDPRLRRRFLQSRPTEERMGPRDSRRAPLESF